MRKETQREAREVRVDSKKYKEVGNSGAVHKCASESGESGACCGACSTTGRALDVERRDNQPACGSMIQRDKSPRYIVVRKGSDSDDAKTWQSSTVVDQVKSWMQLSEIQEQAPMIGSSVNSQLLGFARANVRSPISALCVYWSLRNTMNEKRYAEASELAKLLTSKFSNRYFFGQDLTAIALTELATIHMYMGDLDGALSSFRLALHRKTIAATTIYGSMARVAQRFGRLDLARTAYQRAAEADDAASVCGPKPSIAARRNVQSIDRPFQYARATPEAVAMDLALALARRDKIALESLAAPGDMFFGAAAGGMSLVSREKLIKLLHGSLSSSNIDCDTLQLTGAGNLRMLRSSGWSDSRLAGNLYLLIEQMPTGSWSWTGIAPAAIDQAHEKSFRDVFRPPPVYPDCPTSGFAGPECGRDQLVQELTDINSPRLKLSGITLKAPWPMGWSFRAGSPPLSDSVAVDRTWCSWGEGGWFYNYWNHTGTLTWAIDFTSYLFDMWRLPMLSPAPGIVTREVHDVPDWTYGDPTNGVQVSHSEFADLVDGFADLTAAGVPGSPHPAGSSSPSAVGFARYVSGLVHLSNADVAPLGLIVSTGTIIGRLDKTGWAAMPHLHYHLCDMSLPLPLTWERLFVTPGMTVPPSPMDVGAPDGSGSPFPEHAVEQHIVDHMCLNSTNAPRTPFRAPSSPDSPDSSSGPPRMIDRSRFLTCPDDCLRSPPPPGCPGPPICPR